MKRGEFSKNIAKLIDLKSLHSIFNNLFDEQEDILEELEIQEFSRFLDKRFDYIMQIYMDLSEFLDESEMAKQYISWLIKKRIEPKLIEVLFFGEF